MFILSMLLLFLLACLAAWLLMFPAGRELVLQSLADLGRRAEGQASRANRGGLRQAAATGRAARSAGRRLWQWLRRHIVLALAAGVLLTVPPLLAWLVSNPGMVGGYDGGEHAINAQVADLLRGEQLAPPTPLPPVAFTTAEVTLVRPMLDGASRNWQLLDQAFAQRLLLVFKIMKETNGYDMALLEGYRSPERQDLLASAGSGVTNAKAFQSYHQYGLAADCAFLRDGKLVISEKDPWAMRGYRLYGEAAEAAGLRWGGRWTMMDFGHVELRVPGTIKK